MAEGVPTYFDTGMLANWQFRRAWLMVRHSKIPINCASHSPSPQEAADLHNCFRTAPFPRPQTSLRLRSAPSVDWVSSHIYILSKSLLEKFWKHFLTGVQFLFSKEDSWSETTCDVTKITWIKIRSSSVANRDSSINGRPLYFPRINFLIYNSLLITIDLWPRGGSRYITLFSGVIAFAAY